MPVTSTKGNDQYEVKSICISKIAELLSVKTDITVIMMARVCHLVLYFLSSGND